MKNIFQMDTCCTDSQMDITFHYCPLVAAWRKLTEDEELIAEMCEIAMDGDRGICAQPFWRICCERSGIMETSLLGLIRNYTNHLAKILSDTLDTDILIIDTNMHIVGIAFKYLNLYTDIHFGTLISTIILENRNLIVKDKNRMQGCRKCSQFRECKMSSFVGVPI